MDAGVADATQLSGMTLEQLTAIEGVGEKTAQKLLEAAAAMVAAHAQNRPADAQAVAPTEQAGSTGTADTPDQTDKTEGID